MVIECISCKAVIWQWLQLFPGYGFVICNFVCSWILLSGHAYSVSNKYLLVVSKCMLYKVENHNFNCAM